MLTFLLTRKSDRAADSSEKTPNLKSLQELLTTSELLFKCWNMREANTIPDTRTVGSDMMLVDVRILSPQEAPTTVAPKFQTLHKNNKRNVSTACTVGVVRLS